MASGESVGPDVELRRRTCPLYAVNAGVRRVRRDLNPFTLTCSDARSTTLLMKNAQVTHDHFVSEGDLSLLDAQVDR